MVFFEKLENKYKGKFDTSKSLYVNKREKVIVVCKDCGSTLEQLPYNLLKIGCACCNTRTRLAKFKETFINNARRIHGDKYDYSLVDYKKNSVPVEIVCSKGHHFNMAPSNHASKRNKQGCPFCSGKGSNAHSIALEVFKEKAYELHGDKFLYDNVHYKDSTTKIEITCKKHNKKCLQTPVDHLSGRNPCDLCLVDIRRRSRPSPYNRTKALRGDFKYPSYLYIINLYNETEDFIKVGVAKNMSGRFKEFKTKGYECKLISSLYFKECNDAILLEADLHESVLSFHYNPKTKFSGSCNECFTKDSLKILIPVTN